MFVDAREGIGAEFFNSSCFVFSQPVMRAIQLKQCLLATSAR